MIIKQKEFPNYRKFEIEYEGRPLKMEVGKMAELCNAAVLVTYGETTVLVTCTASARPKDGIDYFPLAVDFNEKLYAVGRIPGSFMRREGKPSLPAVLASRLIDRPMRPLFPSDLRNDVVIACEVLSVDRQPDGYVIRYTYGDFYSHEAIRSSRITVENGKMVITGIAQ